MITTDRAGRQLSRHLRLEGFDIDRIEWQPIKTKDGVLLEKVFQEEQIVVRQHIRPGKDAYRLHMYIEFANHSDSSFAIPIGTRLVLGPGLGEYPVAGFGIAEPLYSFVEPVISVEGNVEGIALDKADGAVSIPLADAKTDWLGLHTRYFALLLAPVGPHTPRAVEVSAESKAGLPGRYLPRVAVDLGITRLEPGETVQRDFLIFSGPKSRSALASAEGDFSRLLFAGLWQWMRGLSLALLGLLTVIYAVVPDWGLAIIMLAVLVRLLMYPLARKVLSSQKAFAEVQRKIQPEMREIKQRYRGGEQSERILQVYERHGVSPLAGLKPLLLVLVQIPIFVALFHVLGQAYELRDASFLWIDTLAEPDRLFRLPVELPFFGVYFNVLPVLMAVTTLLTIKFSPAPTLDSASLRRRNIFLVLMAIGFFAMFYPFPSGMVLYWTMANVLHLVQQRFVEQRPGLQEAGG